MVVVSSGSLSNETALRQPHGGRRPPSVWQIALVSWIPTSASEPRNLRQELAAVRSPAAALTLLMSIAAASSLFILFTYVTPILIAVSGLAEHQVAWALLLCGIGLSIGNLAGARLADWRPLPSFAAVLLALSIILLMFTSLGGPALTPASVLRPPAPGAMSSTPASTCPTGSISFKPTSTPLPVAHRYNNYRPHQALGDRTPAEYLKTISSGPPASHMS